MQPIDTALQSNFGFSSFRPGQREAIESLFNGQHTLVVMPTGAGKSLIYQLAALQFEGLTLVISPLIALMKNQVDTLKQRKIAAAFINSTQPASEQAQHLARLSRGDYRIVYIAPERLRSVPFLQAIRFRKVSLLVVDEAHCISEWGHDFRPDYLHIAEARKKLGNPLTVALTATATPKVQNDIIRLLNLPDSACRIVTGFNRPNLSFEVRYGSGDEAKFRVLSELFNPSPNGATLVYTGTRRDAEETAEFIRTVCELKAEHYHAGLIPEDRESIQEAFITGSTTVVCATNAFGMGIDRADVRQVIHFSLPGSLESYYQEAGRAGRDGLPARAVLLYDPKDRALQEFFISSSILSAEELHLLYHALGNADDELWMTTDDFARRTDLQQVKIKVGLAELERTGAITHLGDDGYRMLLMRGEWDARAIKAAAERSREHAGYRTEQLDAMIRYAESSSCRRRIMLKHFGDTADPIAPVCCDNCISRKALTPKILQSEAEMDVSQMSHAERAALIILDCVQRLKFKVGRDKLAQILHGSKARDIIKFHHDRNIYYGRLAAVRQNDIEVLIGQLAEAGYLKTIGGEYPVLAITPRGENAIKNKESIPLKFPKSFMKSEIQHNKAKLAAGGTVEYTAQLLAQGLTPEEVARQRGLTTMTIYGHCARLIETGKLNVDAVVPKDIRDKIEKAIQAVGPTQELWPIKDLLPEEITFEMIRCVVACLQNEGVLGSSVFPNDEDIDQLVIECVKSLPGKLPRSGIAKLLVGSSSERIDSYRTHPLYNRLAGRSRSAVMEHIDKLLGNGILQKAENGNLILAKTVTSPPEKKTPSKQYSSSTVQADPVATYFSSSHPRPLTGNWNLGFALDFHSSFSGADWNRSGIGGLAYSLKYQSDPSVLPTLVEHTRKLFATHPEMAQFDLILPVPSTTPREFEPVHEFCKALAQTWKKPMQPLLIKTRQTKPQKEMHTLPQKRDNVAGAFALKGDIKGKRILLVDDLFDSGATLEEITRLLLKNGATGVNILTLTRTIHSDV